MKSDTWVATDAISRTLVTGEATGPPRAGKTVGMFYFLWMGQHGTSGPHDITKLTTTNPTNPAWGPVSTFHHWAESELGYYLSDDVYVLRKHAQMLTDAGVDTLIIDTTNGFAYTSNTLKLCQVFQQIRDSGGSTPQICFLAKNSIVQQIYDSLYGKNLYPELWFRWKGKPLILTVDAPTGFSASVQSFFNFRQSWAWSNSGGWFGNGQDRWPWLDHHPQKFGWHDGATVPEEVPVCVAQHATTNIGRSFNARSQPANATALTPFGLCFAEQWQRALSIDPEFIFVTGWNEWVAQRFLSDGNDPFLGRTLPAGESYFVDVYNQEYSRDIEPMKGGHTDNFYYQLVDNIRRYKGARVQSAREPVPSITIDGDFADWATTPDDYRDWSGDAVQRSARGWGTAGTYTNTTGRNDLEVLKVAHDDSNIFFYARTKNALTPYSDQNWMWLLIDRDGNKATGWEGYDYWINGPGRTASTTKVAQNTGTTWNWQDIATVEYKVTGNELELSIPRSALGVAAASSFSFDFHWMDNARATNDITQFFINGDSAPARRFNYRYRATTTSHVDNFTLYE